MAVFKAFNSIRPAEAFASKVAALPYDVMNSDEARAMVEGNPYSFLHVDKAEIDLPKDIDPYDAKVYQKARQSLDELISSGTLIQDEKPCYYIYRQIMDGKEQTGLVGVASIDDYNNSIIKKHELTRADKEQDRINHVDFCDANTGPIFLAYRAQSGISKIISDWKNSNNPVYDFSADDVQNTVWVIDDEETCACLQKLFDSVPSLYIADGHHRCASAVKVGAKRREQNPNYTGQEEFNFFLAVCFPSDELRILDYNRVIADLNGYSEDELLSKLSEVFEIEKAPFAPYKPEQRHNFGLLLSSNWYKLTAKAGSFNELDPVDSLDVSILQKNAIAPIFGIEDPRTDKRIDFVGGIRGLKELERRCNEDMKVAFSMFPTSLDELMAIADAEKIMPPKSTWFEPKLLSGLFIHKLS